MGTLWPRVPGVSTLAGKALSSRERPGRGGKGKGKWGKEVRGPAQLWPWPPMWLLRLRNRNRGVGRRGPAGFGLLWVVRLLDPVYGNGQEPVQKESGPLGNYLKSFSEGIGTMWRVPVFPTQEGGAASSWS